MTDTRIERLNLQLAKAEDEDDQVKAEQLRQDLAEANGVSLNGAAQPRQ